MTLRTSCGSLRLLRSQCRPRRYSNGNLTKWRELSSFPPSPTSLAQSESGALISLSVDGRNWQEIGVLWAAQMCIIGTGDR